MYIKRKRIRLKRAVVSALKLLLGFVLLIVSIVFLIAGSNRNIQKERVIATTSQMNNLDYQVYLKENPYFTVPYLPKGERYITSLIDRIHVSYHHTFRSTKSFDIAYHYRVVGTLSALSKKGEGAYHNIWNKQYIINPEKELRVINSKSFEIQDSFDIDYHYYKNLANQFKNEYQVTSDTILNIKVYLDMEGVITEEQKKMADNTIFEMNIPLDEETIDITTIYNKTIEKQVLKESEVKFVKNTPLFISGCFTFAASVAVVASYLIEFITSSKKQFSFIKEKRKILKKYDQEIVNASKIPDMTGMSMIEVTTFHELIDARKELKVPIIFIEVIPGISGWFIIMKDQQVWRYKLEGKIERKNSRKSHL